MADTTVPEATWTALLEALALPADAAVDTVLAAVEELVTAPEPTPEQVAAAAGLDPTALAQLRHDAEQGKVIAAAEQTRQVRAKVEDAVARGAIAPSRIQHWVTAITADPTMADTLASIPNELAVPLSEAGHGQEHEEVVQEAAWFR
ncbi:hypothetical protein BH93_11420 [Rhodococcoides fascians A25f]|uniref:hypothetical protein n=1 Tax=Rhodococcoides fascians TaxID=1828 RepID=UPI000566BA4A|nr:hypothetical protein [Rhodococcus fascians]QII05900.1 hypothetical protein BH93_11420 [Rhodococcus fascians A25f]